MSSKPLYTCQCPPQFDLNNIFRPAKKLDKFKRFSAHVVRDVIINTIVIIIIIITIIIVTIIIIVIIIIVIIVIIIIIIIIIIIVVIIIIIIMDIITIVITIVIVIIITIVVVIVIIIVTIIVIVIIIIIIAMVMIIIVIIFPCTDGKFFEYLEASKCSKKSCTQFTPTLFIRRFFLRQVGYLTDRRHLRSLLFIYKTAKHKPIEIDFH